MFCISNTSSEDLPVSVVPYTDNYEKRFADILDSVSHFEIRCINEQIRDMRIDRSL